MWFGDVMDVLNAAFEIEDGAKQAFKVRVQILLRGGLVPHANKGRGSKAEYSFKHLSAMAFGVVMTDLGLMPEQIVGILGGDDGWLDELISSVFDDQQVDAEILFSPNVLDKFRASRYASPFLGYRLSRTGLMTMIHGLPPRYLVAVPVGRLLVDLRNLQDGLAVV